MPEYRRYAWCSIAMNFLHSNDMRHSRFEKTLNAIEMLIALNIQLENSNWLNHSCYNSL